MSQFASFGKQNAIVTNCQDCIHKILVPYSRSFLGSGARVRRTEHIERLYEVLGSPADIVSDPESCVRWPYALPNSTYRHQHWGDGGEVVSNPLPEAERTMRSK